MRNQRIESRKKIVEGTANARDIFRALGTTNINLNPQNIRKIKVLADENISNRNLNKALKNEKPIFTVGTALRIQGKKPKSKSGVKFIKNSQGQVIGVQDPFLKMSYGFNRPVNEKALKEAFQERQLEKEYLVQFRKQQAQKKFEKLKPLDERYQAIKERLKKNQKARQKFKSVTDKVVDGIAKISSFYPPNYLFKKIYPDSLYNYGLEVTKELATIPYDFTIGLGRSLAGGVDQVAFQIQAVGFKGYGKEVLNQLRLENAPLSVLKSYDIRKPEGMANLLLTAIFVRSGAKSLSNARKVKAIKRQNMKGKIGEVIQDNRGYAIITKGGKTIRVPKGAVRALLRANKKGRPIRAKRTKVARTTQKQLKGKITRKEGNLLRKAKKKATTKKINNEANKLSNKYRLKGKERESFQRLYKNFRKKPTQKNAKTLRRFSDKISVDEIVRAIDSRITKSLRKPIKRTKTTKPKVKKRKPKTNKQKLKQFKKKTKKEFSKQRKRADAQARRKGFKDAKEQVTYEKAFDEYLTGNIKAKRTLSKIESNMFKRKSRISKAKAKAFRKQRKDLVQQAKRDLSSGKIKIKNRRRTIRPQQKKITRKISKEFPLIGEKYNVVGTKTGTVQLRPKAKLKNKVVTSKQILKRSGVKSKDNVKIGTSGTISILKTKKKIKTPKIKRVPKSRVSVLPTTISLAVSSATRNLDKIKSGYRKAFDIVKKPATRITTTQLRITENKVDNLIDTTNDIKNDIKNILDQDIQPVQKQKLRQKLKQVNEQLTKLKNLKKRAKSKQKTKKEKIKKLILPKLPSWRTQKLPRGYRLKVQPLIKRKGKIRNLGKPTTTNRGLRRGIRATSNTLARSFQLKVVGITKQKDSKKPSLSKYRSKISSNPKVLGIVEKTKYALNTKGEKRQIKRARRVKKNAKKTKNTSKGKKNSKKRTRRKTSKSSRSNKKRSKKTRRKVRSGNSRKTRKKSLSRRRRRKKNR